MTENNIIIGIDTSCYTTSIAAISLNGDIIFNEKTMLSVNENSIGLRQSEAVFQHIKNIGVMSDKIKEKLDGYNVCAICASEKPRPVEESYMPVFSVGHSFAKLNSASGGYPVYTTTHQENHIKAALYKTEGITEEKFISVHMSGGTMEILLTEKNGFGYRVEIIGGTKDISIGQLIDRVGVKLGYRFPAGSYIDKEAINYSGEIKSGLKTSVKDGYMNISGLENQAMKLIENGEIVGYTAKAVMNASIKSLEKALVYLCDKYDIYEILFAGGVASSRYIRKNLSYRLNKKGIKTIFGEPQYSSDNAVGCAIIGLEKYLED